MAFNGNVGQLCSKAGPDFSRFLHGYPGPEGKVLNGRRTVSAQVAAQEELLGGELIDHFLLWQPLVDADEYRFIAPPLAMLGTVADQAFQKRWADDAPHRLHPSLSFPVDPWPDRLGQVALAHGSGVKSFHYQAV